MVRMADIDRGPLTARTSILAACLLVPLMSALGCSGGGDDVGGPASAATTPPDAGSASPPPSTSQESAGLRSPSPSSIIGAPDLLGPPMASVPELQLPLRPPRAPAPPLDPSESTDGGYFAAMMVALSDGQFTSNNPWTRSDLDDAGVPTVDYQRTVDRNLAGQVRPYTTLVQQYRVKRSQCQEDTGVLNADGEQSCYPKLQRRTLVNGIGRYGYYCGGGFPSHGPFWRGTPEPLDGVDYCCRLHDQRVWNAAGYSDECGIAMCLYKMSGSPGVMAQLPDVAEARQFWYDFSKLGCPFTNLDGVAAPAIGP